MSAATPRQVFEQLSAGITSGAWAGLAGLYAEDAVVEMPFALPGPVRLHGRDEVRRHFAANAAGPVRLQAYDVRVHETADPEVIVAEYGYRGTVAGSPAFDVANVQVLRVRDGLIVESRDYHHHAAIAAAVKSAG
jgi:ketosteroid isomerase-like protein